MPRGPSPAQGGSRRWGVGMPSPHFVTKYFTFVLSLMSLKLSLITISTPPPSKIPGSAPGKDCVIII